MRPISLSIVVPSQTKDCQTTLNSSYRCAKNKASSSYKEIKSSFLCLNLIGISRFFTKYCIMQYFTCKYCKQITVCVMRKTMICKNIFILLSKLRINIVSRKRGLSQKVFKLLHTSLCLLVDRTLRSGTPSVWLFSVILLFYNHRDVSISRTASGNQFAMLIFKAVNEYASAIWITSWCCCLEADL